VEATSTLRAHTIGALHSRTIEKRMASENKIKINRLQDIVFDSLMLYVN